MTQPKSIPIACTLSDDALNIRKENELAILFQKATQMESLDNGYAFKFPGDAETTQLLFDFVAVERECCAFFKFELTFEPQKGPVWLTVSGGDGVKAFIELEGIPKT